MNKIKQKKIESMLVREISNIIINEAADSYLKGVTITSASISNDLSYAKIYFTTIYDNEHEKDEKEMAESASYIRKILSDSIEIRHTPKLKFIYDNSIEYGQNIDKIIEKLKNKI